MLQLFRQFLFKGAGALSLLGLLSSFAHADIISIEARGIFTSILSGSTIKSGDPFSVLLSYTNPTPISGIGGNIGAYGLESQNPTLIFNTTAFSFNDAQGLGLFVANDAFSYVGTVDQYSWWYQTDHVAGTAISLSFLELALGSSNLGLFSTLAPPTALNFSDFDAEQFVSINGFDSNLPYPASSFLAGGLITEFKATVTPVAVPESSTFALLGAGSLIAIALGRMRAPRNHR